MYGEWPGKCRADGRSGNRCVGQSGDGESIESLTASSGHLEDGRSGE